MIIYSVIEYGFTASLFMNAILFVPQIMRLVASKDSKEVSLITFLGFLLIQMATVLHGFLRKDYLLALGTLASMMTCGAVVCLIILYRVKK